MLPHRTTVLVPEAATTRVSFRHVCGAVADRKKISYVGLYVTGVSEMA